MKNKISATIAITFLLVTVAAFAANFTDDTLQIGKPGSSADKSVVFGASNKKKLSHKPSTQTLDYEGNNLSVGDGLNTSDKTLKLNKGANSPTLRHNFTSGDLEIENAPVLNQKGNTISVGDGTNTNKVLKFNKGASSPEIRFNSTTGKLQFTNDTVAYKDIGSGSGGGGGTNLLQDFNSDFESGSPPQNWTASGGTFIAETASPLFGLQSGSWDSSASAQTLSSQLVTIEPGFIGKKCTADIEYRWPSGVSGDLSFQVVDQVPNILATANLEATTGSNTRKAFLAFDCPTVATDQLRVRLLSNVANPALIVVDNAFVGVNKSTTNVSQAVFAGESYWNSTVGCTWTRSSATLGPVGAIAACPGPTIVDSTVGVWQTTDTDLPRQTITNLPAGKYRATFWTQQSASANVATALAINDGTTTCEAVSGEHSNSSSSGMTVSCVFTYLTPQASRTFELYTAAAAGNSTTLANSNISPKYSTKFQLEKFPVNDSEALNLETTGWFIDANIGGATFNVIGAQSTYTEIGNPNLDMVINTSKGSATAEITCAGTNPSTGLTCAAGSETLGIAFTPPYAGTFEVCVDFWVNNQPATYKTFQLVETPNNAQTILQEGGQRTGGGGTTTDYSQHTCGTFTFASATKRTIRLMYEAADNGTTSIALDRAGTLGQRDLKITVRPYTQNFPAPVFTEVRNKMNAGQANTKTCAILIENTAGTPTINKQTCGGWVTSLTDLGVGQIGVNFPGAFSDLPICTATGQEGTGVGAEMQSLTSSSLQLVTRVFNTGAVNDEDVSLICVGVQ